MLYSQGLLLPTRKTLFLQWSSDDQKSFEDDIAEARDLTNRIIVSA